MQKHPVGHFIRPLLRNPFLVLLILEALLFGVAMWLAGGKPLPLSPGKLEQLEVYGSVMVLGQCSMGLYSRHQRMRFAGVVLRVMATVVGGSAVVAILQFIFGDLGFMPYPVAIAGVIAIVFVTAIRLVFERMADESVFRRRVLVLGAGEAAAHLAKLKGRIDERGFIIQGYVFFPGDRLSREVGPVIEPGADLAGYCRREDIEQIVVALDDPKHQLPFQELLDARFAGISIVRLIDFLERETGRVFIDVAHPSWLIFSGGFKQSAWKRLLRRLFDIAVSGAILVLASPLMLLVALVIKLTEGPRAPILYSQLRVGLHGRLFRVLKFRSMRVDAEKNGAQWATHNDARVTRFGAFMRKTRIDELPQALNVLRGDMSLVGPRPERPEFVAGLEQRIPYYRERHAVKPGLTGWAQLCYSYGASERDALEKLQYDLYYIKNHSLRFDLRILLQTAEVVLWGKGR